LFDGAAHGQLGGLQDVERVDFADRGDADAGAVRGNDDLVKEFAFGGV
jgi:hypothetical protein